MLLLPPFAFQSAATHVRWTSSGSLEAARISVCWETDTKPGPAAVALDSAWAAMASPAKVSAVCAIHFSSS